MTEPVRVYIERVKAAFGVVTDEDLAFRLGLSKQAIANWRKRDKIPMNIQLQIAQIFGDDLSFSEKASKLGKFREDEIVYAAAIYAFERNFKILGREPTLRERLSFGFFFDDVEKEIRTYLKNMMKARRIVSISIDETTESILSSIMFAIDKNRIPLIDTVNQYIVDK